MLRQHDASRSIFMGPSSRLRHLGLALLVCGPCAGASVGCDDEVEFLVRDDTGVEADVPSGGSDSTGGPTDTTLPDDDGGAASSDADSDAGAVSPVGAVPDTTEPDAEVPDTVADIGPVAPSGPVPGDAPPVVTFDGRHVLVNGEELEIRGVNWSPIGVGDTTPWGVDWSGFVAQDAPLMAAAGFNAVRTFGAIDDTDVLDTLAEHGLWVLMSVYVGSAEAVTVVDARVNAVKDHPAVLLWQVGNEWNYNSLYSPMSFEAARERVEEVAARIQTLDDRPVATVYGELPSIETVALLPSVDVWGLNAYRYDGFYGLFESWESLSSLPMYVAEYGVDAYNANLPGYDPASHELGTRRLVGEMLDAHTSRGGVAIGGCLFEWADEWWKDASGSPNVQNTGGVAPGGGPFPDGVFNEEWWGLVDVYRTPRPAYDAVKELFAGE